MPIPANYYYYYYYIYIYIYIYRVLLYCRMTLPLRMLKELAGRDADSTDIFQTSDIDRYWARPRIAPFSDMCLANFVADYKVVYGKQASMKECTEEEEEESDKTQPIKLLDGKGMIAKRRRPCVIRYMRMSKEKDPEKHYSNQLRLFLPHRGKELKPHTYCTYEMFYNSGTAVTVQGRTPVRDLVSVNMKKYEHNADVVDNAWELIQNQGIAEDVWADIAPNAEEEIHDGDLRPEHLQLDDEQAEDVIPELDRLGGEDRCPPMADRSRGHTWDAP